MSSETEETGPKKGRSKKCIFCICSCGCVGLGLSIVAFAVLWGREYLKIRDEFEGTAAVVVVALGEAARNNVRELETAAVLLGQSLPFGREVFKEVAGPIVKANTGLAAMNWVPRISHEERESWEAFGRREYSPDFQFLDEGRIRTHSRAALRKEYFPILFTEPIEGNRSALGLDISSNERQHNALERARDSGEVVISLPFRLKQEAGLQNSYTLLTPIYSGGSTPHTKEQRQEQLLGYLEGAYRSGDMVLSALEFVALDDIQLWFYDLMDRNKQPFLFVEVIEWEPRVSFASFGEAAAALKGLSIKEKVAHAGHDWGIVVKATPGYIWSHSSLEPVGVLAVGLLLTVLVSRILIRRTRVEEGVVPAPVVESR